MQCMGSANGLERVGRQTRLTRLPRSPQPAGHAPQPAQPCTLLCPVLQVVEQGPGQYFCEYDGSTLSSMVRRYIFSARIMDESGECNVQVFNEQVSCATCWLPLWRSLLGSS